MLVRWLPIRWTDQEIAVRSTKPAEFAMKILPIPNDASEVHAFQVPNMWLSRGAAFNVVKNTPGVTVLRPPRRMFSRQPDRDDFCQFQIGKRTFVIWEPWGDSSRYWIGSDPAEPSAELKLLAASFASYRPFLHWSALIRLALLLVIPAAIIASLLHRVH
jgi:hypothetical protein